MPNLIQTKLAGAFTEAEHHKIAAELASQSDKWDAIELSTGVRPVEAFGYSVGLIMGKEIVLSCPLEKKDILIQKINSIRIDKPPLVVEVE